MPLLKVRTQSAGRAQRDVSVEPIPQVHGRRARTPITGAQRRRALRRLPTRLVSATIPDTQLGALDMPGGGGDMNAGAGTPAIFISYASQDAAIADAVVGALEHAGLPCWIAPRNVVPGSLYADEIVGAINDSKAIVLVLSEHAISSPHVGKEIERASSKRRRIIALRVDSAPLTKAFEYFLSESQWIELGPGGTDRAVAKLAEAVRRHLDPSGVPDPRVQAGRPGGGSRSHAPLTIWIAAGGIVGALLAFAFFVGDRLWPPRHAAPESRAASAGPATPTFSPPPNSIAVLPFVNMSGDSNQEYFSDGISEELLDSLSRLAQLHVAARTSSFSFKAQNLDTLTIARRLNVGVIVEGSVRRAGSTVRITAQMIDAVTGYHVWSQTYDRSLNDILKVQTEVATSVVEHLKIRLAGDESAKLELGGTHNPEAYDAYLRGQMANARDVSTENVAAATTAFDRAITLDPNFARAYVGRSTALSNRAVVLATPDEVPDLQRATLAAASRAVALAPDLGPAHAAVGFARGFVLLDFRSAAPEFDRALELAPGNYSVVATYAAFATAIGHRNQAIAAAKRAVSLNPLVAHTHEMLALTLYYAKRFNEAMEVLEAARTLDPNSHFIEEIAVGSLLGSGQFERVLERCTSVAAPLDEDVRHKFLAIALHALGRQADAERELTVLKATMKRTAWAPYEIARVYAQWSDAPAALRWLAEAERVHSPGFQILRVDWMLDSIRSEPEFRAIEARLKFPPP